MSPEQMSRNWQEEKVAVIGCGVMAQCLVDGWLKHGIFKAEQMTLTDALPAALAALKTKYPACAVQADNHAAVKDASLIIICVKPFMVQKVLSQLVAADGSLFRDKTVLSVAAGLRLSLYWDILRDNEPRAIIRAMPNIACRVDHGMTAVCGNSAANGISCDPALLAATESLFAPLGGWSLVEDEKLMDVVTALNGSALAFGCMAIEAMADGAVAMGLPRKTALSMASHALLAASALQLRSDEHPAVLRDQITTPGGCTIAGLLALEDGNFRSTLAKAVQETTRVSKELGACQK